MPGRSRGEAQEHGSSAEGVDRPWHYFPIAGRTENGSKRKLRNPWISILIWPRTAPAIRTWEVLASTSLETSGPRTSRPDAHLI